MFVSHNACSKFLADSCRCTITHGKEKLRSLFVQRPIKGKKQNWKSAWPILTVVLVRHSGCFWEDWPFNPWCKSCQRIIACNESSNVLLVWRKSFSDIALWQIWNVGMKMREVTRSCPSFADHLQFDAAWRASEWTSLCCRVRQKCFQGVIILPIYVSKQTLEQMNLQTLCVHIFDIWKHQNTFCEL